MKVLLAIDDSEVSRKAVAFCGKMLGRGTYPDLDVTLFHVVESLPDFILARSGDTSGGSAYRQVAEDWAENNRQGGEKLLSAQKQALAATGIPDERINTKLCQKESRPEARRVVAAMGIIEEMKSGRYDVVIIGRRGASASLETFLGSVAEKVAREANGRTLWIVD